VFAINYYIYKLKCIYCRCKQVHIYIYYVCNIGRLCFHYRCFTHKDQIKSRKKMTITTVSTLPNLCIYTTSELIIYCIYSHDMCKKSPIQSCTKSPGVLGKYINNCKNLKLKSKKTSPFTTNPDHHNQQPATERLIKPSHANIYINVTKDQQSFKLSFTVINRNQILLLKFLDLFNSFKIPLYPAYHDCFLKSHKSRKCQIIIIH